MLEVHEDFRLSAVIAHSVLVLKHIIPDHCSFVYYKQKFYDNCYKTVMLKFQFHLEN